MKRARKSTKRMKRSNKRKYTRKSARKSARKTARKSTRRSMRKYVRKSTRRSTRKSTRRSTKRYNGKQMGGVNPSDIVNKGNSQLVTSLLIEKAGGVISEEDITQLVNTAMEGGLTFEIFNEGFNEILTGILIPLFNERAGEVISEEDIKESVTSAIGEGKPVQRIVEGFNEILTGILIPLFNERAGEVISEEDIKESVTSAIGEGKPVQRIVERFNKILTRRLIPLFNERAGGVISKEDITQSVKKSIEKGKSVQQIVERFNKILTERNGMIAQIVAGGYDRSVTIFALEETNYNLKKARGNLEELKRQSEMGGIRDRPSVTHELWFFNTLTGEKTMLNVRNRETIAEIKRKLSTTLSDDEIPPENIRLIYAGTEFDGDKIIDECYKLGKNNKPINVVLKDPPVGSPSGRIPRAAPVPRPAAGTRPAAGPRRAPVVITAHMQEYINTLPPEEQGMARDAMTQYRNFGGMEPNEAIEEYKDTKEIVRILNGLNLKTTEDEINLFRKIRDPETGRIEVGQTVMSYRLSK